MKHDTFDVYICPLQMEQRHGEWIVTITTQEAREHDEKSVFRYLVPDEALAWRVALGGIEVSGHSSASQAGRWFYEVPAELVARGLVEASRGIPIMTIESLYNDRR